MASTFSLASHSYGGRYLLLECTQKKDIANNKSPVEWKLSSIGGEVNYYTTDVTVAINGTDVYKSGRTEWNTERFPAAKGSTSGTTYVDHDTYGKKTITVKMVAMIYDGVWRTHEDTWTLDDIPRQAELTYAPDFTDNSNPTITYKNPAGNAVDSLQACISWTGGADITYRDIPKTGTSETLSYTFPFTEAERATLRNATPTGVRNVTFYVTTWIGSNVFFSTQPVELSIEETEATKPSVSMSVTLDNGSLPSESASKFDGLWIQGKSRADVYITAQGQYSATINNSSIFAQIGRVAYNSADFKSNVIEEVGSVDIIATAKDSRKFTGEAKETITVIQYSKPLVIPIGTENAILCYRSDGNGNRIGNSTSLWIKAKRSYYSVNALNTCALQWRWKLSTDAWGGDEEGWTDLISKATTNMDEYNALVSADPFDLRKSYTVQIRAKDDIGEKDVKTFDIPTQDVALHLGKGGKNVSVGTYCDYSEEYTFYSDWKAIFDKGFVDGSDTGWIALNEFTSYRCKCGYVSVVVWCGGEMVLTPETYTEIGTLPEGYRPPFNIPFTYHTQGGSPPSQSAYIGVDGKILVYTKATNSDYFAFTVTYPI
jgi:hypothetical protein